MSCKGLHCGGCGKGGGGAVPIGLIVLVVIGAWVCSAVAPAVGEAFHVLAVVLEVVLITIASAAGLGVLAGLTWAGIRIHRRYAARAAAAGSPRAQPASTGHCRGSATRTAGHRGA